MKIGIAIVLALIISGCASQVTPQQTLDDKLWLEIDEELNNGAVKYILPGKVSVSNEQILVEYTSAQAAGENAQYTQWNHLLKVVYDFAQENNLSPQKYVFKWGHFVKDDLFYEIELSSQQAEEFITGLKNYEDWQEIVG